MLIKMRREINLLNWKFNRRRQFLTVCQNSHVSEKRRKKLMITLFTLLSLWKIFTISLQMNLRQKKERNSSLNVNSHPSIRFCLMSSEKKRKWTFASGEVDLGELMFTFFPLLASYNFNLHHIYNMYGGKI